MRCPKCGARTHVKRNLPSTSKQVRRRRECTSPTCRHVFVTVEERAVQLWVRDSLRGR